MLRYAALLKQTISVNGYVVPRLDHSEKFVSPFNINCSDTEL